MQPKGTGFILTKFDLIKYLVAKPPGKYEELSKHYEGMIKKYMPDLWNEIYNMVRRERINTFFTSTSIEVERDEKGKPIILDQRGGIDVYKPASPLRFSESEIQSLIRWIFSL